MFLPLLLPPLLYLPGWLLLRAWPTLMSDDQLERHYERVVVGVLFNGWLALILATLGIFSLWLHLGTITLVAALLFLRTRTQPPPAPAAPAHWGEIVAFAVIGCVALLLVVRPFEVILGTRDAGVYATSGLAIARTGSLVQTDALIAELGQSATAADPAIREPAAQSLSNFLGVQHRERFIATRLRAAGYLINDGEAALGRVVPQFLHLFPAWIGLLAAIGGPYAGLFAPGLMGLLGAWSVGMLGRRLAGRWVGLLAMLFLALNGVQVWFARYSTTETTTQFLIMAGLYLFARAVTAPRGEGAAALAGLAFGQVALTRIDFFLALGPLTAYLFYCALSRRWQRVQTAMAIGLGVMLLHAVLHILFISRAYFFDTAYARLQDYALTATLALPFLTQVLTEVYHTRTGSPLKDPTRIWRELALVGAGLGALVALWRWQTPIRLIEGLVMRFAVWLRRGMALLVLLLAGYAYLIRPQILDTDLLFNQRGGWNDPLTRNPALVRNDVIAGRMDLQQAQRQAGVILEGKNATVAANATSALREQLTAARGPWQGPWSNQTFNWLRLQGYVGAPIALPTNMRDLYAIPLANMVRMGWYLSPLGILLGSIGAALWWWRGLTKAAWLFLTIALVGTFFYVRQTYGTSEQTYIYILRRFLPIAYPAFSLGIAYALVALAFSPPAGSAKAAHQRNSLLGTLATIRLLFASSLGLAFILFFGWTNRPIYGHVEYRGAVEQLQAVASRFTPGRDVLLLRGGAPTYAQSRDIPDLVTTPLRFAFGLDALTVKSAQPGAYADALAAQVRHWQQAGREVYVMLSASGGSFVLPGFHLAQTGAFTLNVPEFEQLVNQKPQNIAQLRLVFTIYRLVATAPALLDTPPLPLTPADTGAQVNGFYQPEPDRTGQTYAWTDGDALVRIAGRGAQQRTQLTLTLAGGLRPSSIGPAQVCLTIQPETHPWPAESIATPLGCLTLSEEMHDYTISIPPMALPPSQSMLLRLTSDAWVPATVDERQNDQRSLGVQFGGAR